MDREFATGRLLHGDCIERMRALPDASIDAIITDPPYGIEFLGHEWDSFGPQRDARTAGRVGAGAVSRGNIKDKSTSPGGRVSYGGKRTMTSVCKGCGKRDQFQQPHTCPEGTGWEKTPVNPGQAPDAMIAYQAWFTEVARECYRVLKPGGHLVSFGGTRTFHRLACAIEDAGFEIRDRAVVWGYGQGYPKMFSVERALKDHPDAKLWAGWDVNLKPANEPICLARKPLISTVAGNVLEHGTGALNIDATRVRGNDRFGGGAKGSSGFVDGYEGDGWQEGNEKGRWPANLVIVHHPDCRQVGALIEDVAQNVGFTDERQSPNWGTRRTVTEAAEATTPVWECVPGCPAVELDAHTGVLRSGVMKAGTETQGYDGPSMGSWKPGVVRTTTYGDAGGASRYFNQFGWGDADLGGWPDLLYYPKPNKAEKAAGVPAGTTAHPTVKNLACMRHLVRLVVGGRPDAVVLDPFLGSATTAVACVLEGVRWVGCEVTDTYLPIIDGRVTWAEGEVAAGRAASPSFKPVKPKKGADEIGTQLTIEDALGEAA